MSITNVHTSHGDVAPPLQREPVSRQVTDGGTLVEANGQPLHPRGPDTIVEFSPQAIATADTESPPKMLAGDHSDSGEPPKSGHGSAQSEQQSADGTPLTDEQRQEIELLKKRDQEVRRHEAAHKAAAGQYAKGAPRFTFQTGPDGKPYAVGGEVQIDTSPVEGDPQATIRKMETVRRAALAPAEPSSQDRAVAAQAAATAQQARQELRRQPSGVSGGPSSSAAAGTSQTAVETVNGTGPLSDTTENDSQTHNPPTPPQSLAPSRRDGLPDSVGHGPGRLLDTRA